MADALLMLGRTSTGVIVPIQVSTTGALMIQDDTAWTNYSDLSTVVGWSLPFTQKHIYVKKYGKTCFVRFVISGTSNSSVVSFTVPDGSINAGFATYQLIRIVNNSGAETVGLMIFPINSNVVNCYSSVPGAGWTASGQKTVFGEFFYETAA
jgi:hypothetical protein